MSMFPSRVLDFGKINPFGRTIGQSRNLLWPVQAFRVTLPDSSNSRMNDLNAFESVIIDALRIRAGLSEHLLADVVCLPNDLVRNVLLRLEDKGLVNAHNVVVSNSHSVDNATNPSERYTSAMIFREMVGGTLLPSVHELGKADAIVSGPIGPGWRMAIDRDVVSGQVPSPSEVLSIVKKSRKRDREHRKGNQFPKVNQIRVNNEIEHYYLDCPIAFMSFDADFRIADPFGVGFSAMLERIFAERLQSDERLADWMANWRERLASSRPNHVAGLSTTAPFVTEENVQLFPALINVLTPSAGRMNRNVLELYASIEWAMYYCCEIHDPAVSVRAAKRLTPMEFGVWTTQIANSLGLVPPRNGFRKPTNGKLENYFQGRPEMETLCVLMLIQAESNVAHPFRFIATKYPDFFSRLDSLRESRGHQGHGRSSGVIADIEMTSDGFMRSVVSTLIPSVVFDEAPNSASDSDRLALTMLRARMSVLDVIEYRIFNALGPSTQSALIAAEVAWLERVDGEDARTYIAHLYSALQSVIRRVINRLPVKSVEEDNFNSVAMRNAMAAGHGDLPSELRSVRTWRTREAISGNDPTLGAATVAFLLMAPSDLLAEVAVADRAFLKTISIVVRLRGHANQKVEVSDVDLVKIREDVLLTIATLLELTE
jgi:hypothetical protein